MPLINTKVGLCNEALLLLGSGQIVSFDEATDKAEVCARLYEGVVQELLCARAWRFTMEKRQLARLAGAPVNEWKYAYQLPSDSLSGGAWVVFDSLDESARSTTHFEIYGNKLLADAEVIVLDYQVEPTVDKFTPAFRTLVKYALAAAFAIPVTEQTPLMEKYDSIAFGVPSDNRQGGMFRVAAQQDAKGTRSPKFNTDEIVAARFS